MRPWEKKFLRAQEVADEGVDSGGRAALRKRSRWPVLRITFAAALLVGSAFVFGGVRTGVMVLLLVLFALPCLLMLLMALDKKEPE